MQNKFNQIEKYLSALLHARHQIRFHLKKNNIFALKLLSLGRKYDRDYKLFTQI